MAKLFQTELRLGRYWVCCRVGGKGIVFMENKVITLHLTPAQYSYVQPPPATQPFKFYRKSDTEKPGKHLLIVISFIIRGFVRPI